MHCDGQAVLPDRMFSDWNLGQFLGPGTACLSDIVAVGVELQDYVTLLNASSFLPSSAQSRYVEAVS